MQKENTSGFILTFVRPEIKIDDSIRCKIFNIYELYKKSVFEKDMKTKCIHRKLMSLKNVIFHAILLQI